MKMHFIWQKTYVMLTLCYFLLLQKQAGIEISFQNEPLNTSIACFSVSLALEKKKVSATHAKVWFSLLFKPGDCKVSEWSLCFGESNSVIFCFDLMSFLGVSGYLVKFQ